MENKKFAYYDSKNNPQEVLIDPSDFTFVQAEKELKDQKLERKPTTFFKDALKRFRKNKSSVAGAVILGIIALLTIFVPIISQSDIDTTHAYETLLEPKLFPAGTGFWDGCKDYSGITMDIDWDKYDETGEIDGLPAGFAEKDIVGGKSGITMTKIGENYTNAASAYAHAGMARLFSTSDTTYPELRTPYATSMDFTSDLGYKVTIVTSDPSGYSDYTFGDIAPYSLYFSITVDETETRIPLLSGITSFGEQTVTLYEHLSEIQEAFGSETVTLTEENAPRFVVVLDEAGASDTKNVLIDSLVVTSTDAAQTEILEAMSFDDANDMVYSLSQTGTENPFVVRNGTISVFHADIIYASFRFDTYENAYGNYTNNSITMTQLTTYKNNGWINIDLSPLDGYEDMTRSQRTAAIEEVVAGFEILDELHSPIVDDGTFTGTSVSAAGKVAISFSATVTRWKELYPGTDSMPSFLFGTDSAGRDMFKYVFAGLRTSLMLGVIAFAVCFTFGLIWGAISGYFGGWTDIIMERFVEILSGVPWIVVMTLAMIKFGQNMLTFGMAICLTGWIGTSGITRTQFYRYKDREYILAARTLGAKDTRLIFRHILPNAMGTIITSCVLMIPSVIYSEATIAYLGLGLQGTAALGVILSDNQRYIQTAPHLILFPSFVMALMMISFNLFGNGLRDAFNPSLKGQE